MRDGSGVRGRGNPPLSVPARSAAPPPDRPCRAAAGCPPEVTLPGFRARRVRIRPGSSSLRPSPAMPWTALAVRSIVTPSSGVRSPSRTRSASIVIMEIVVEIAFGPQGVAHHKAEAQRQQQGDEESRGAQFGGQRPAGGVRSGW